MMELFHIYFWTILAACAAGPVLALLGTQLATRDRAMQTLCVGQGATVGVLFAMGVLHQWEDTLIGTIGPFVFALLFSGLTFITADRLVEKRQASKNTFFAFLFAILMSAGHLISSIFPALENHMVQIYFGDLATLSEFNSIVTVVGSCILMVVLLFTLRKISNRSFELSVFGSEVPSPREDRFFQFLAVTILCFSVQYVGFLYTISMLFLPTSLFNFIRTKGLKLHLILCVVLSTVSAAVGFGLSLQFTRLPTVPAVAMSLFVIGMLIIGVERLLTSSPSEVSLKDGILAQSQMREESP